MKTPPTPTQRILDVVPLVPSTGALAGWAAAHVHGVDLLDGLDPYSMRALPTEICLGRDAGRASGDQVRYSRNPLPDRHRELRHGLWVTTALRTAFDVREEKLEAANLTACRVDSLDLRSSLALKDRLQARHFQATQRDRRQDGWTLEQPLWWRRKHAS